MAFTLVSPLAEFSNFLRDTFGIMGNKYTPRAARAAADSGGSAWQEFCDAWGEERQKLTDLRAVLLACVVASSVAFTSVCIYAHNCWGYPANPAASLTHGSEMPEWK